MQPRTEPGEALFDPDGLFYGASTQLFTLTGTVQYRPSVFEGALFRVEQRVESASRDIFDTAAGPRGTWYSTLFGLVVETSFGS